MKPGSKASTFGLIAIIAIALLLIPGVIAVMLSLATRPYIGWTVVSDDDGRVIITDVESESGAARAALRAGDELLRVDGSPPDRFLGKSAGKVLELDLINRYDAGDEIVFEARQGGISQALSARLPNIPGALVTTHLVLFFVFWAIAAVLLFARPHDPLVRLLVLTILALSAGNFFRPATDLPLNTTSGMLLQQICAIGRFLGPALLVNFGLVFPRPTLSRRKIAIIRGLAFGIPGALFLVEEWVIWRGAHSPAAPYLIYEGVLATIRYFDIRFFVFLASWIACGALLLRATRFLAGKEKTQVKWVMWSVLFAAIADTVIVVIALYGAGRYSDYLLSPYRNLLYLTIAASMLIAIMRYDMFDIDRVIRGSVLYSITTALMFLVFTGCENVISGALAGRLPSRLTPVNTLIAAILAAALFTPVRKLLDRMIGSVFGRRRVSATAQAQLYKEL
jgi:hypothetical protein